MEQRRKTLEWHRPSEQLPRSGYGQVLVIVSGSPKKKMGLLNAYELAEYVNGEGWILEMYPEWNGADVHWWAYLPEYPDEV